MTNPASRPGHSSYSQEETKALARQWTRHMWNASLWQQVQWLGVPVLQWPTDLILMQELITRLRPRIIIETGLYLGGTSVFYASLLHLLRIEGTVISVDIEINPEARRNVSSSDFADRIRLIEGDSKSEEVHGQIRDLIGKMTGEMTDAESSVLVCLDSDHSRAHCLEELRLFSRYVPVGGYLVLFDTICEDLCATPNGDPGWAGDSPMAALREFVGENDAFQSDHSYDKFMVGFAPHGFLKRIR